MFLGEFEHTIDDKGRLAVPARFRARLAEGAVVTRGLDRCLALYPQDTWRALAEKLAALPTSRADARSLQRLQFSGAAECEFDRQGRIIVPAYLREYAGLQVEVVVVGLYARIEIWERRAWGEIKRDAEARGGEIAEHLASLGV